MRFYHMETTMSRGEQSKSAPPWLSGIVVMAITMVCLFAFAKISIFAVVAASGSVMIVGLVVSWFLGRRLRERRGR